MKLDIFCAWGDGPDVGINFIRTEEEAEEWFNPHLNFFYDLTSAEARKMAAKLIQCAEEAEAMDDNASMDSPPAFEGTVEEFARFIEEEVGIK